ncbi:SDR family NAD(P)-dependent oxidoreductase [Devosia nitrariae]|uniref:Short-chain dehydrogenase n=1 Tax=Devosia nitrariae TaxID=2071872 RepID=A0ABQ5WCH6_9HYPH|nr:SDR family oxidoreductase [Devosia nitrariae]GLQ57499.1 short-chain dehydrogenase [Devosia nitrariae]
MPSHLDWLRRGAIVLVADLDEDAANATAKNIADAGGRAVAVVVDMREPASIEQLLRLADRQPEPLGVLINNAGGGGEKPPHFPDAEPAIWKTKVDLNLIGPMYATQLAVRSMIAVGGVVVNIASTAGLGLLPYVSPEYAAAKAALIRFTATLGARWDHIRINCLVPDWILTERAQRELSDRSASERTAVPTPIPLDHLTAAVMKLVCDEELSGRIMVLRGNEAAEFLGPADG